MTAPDQGITPDHRTRGESSLERVFRVTARMALISGVVLAVLGLLFRSLIWASWPPASGDPYGASDILELFIFLLIILCSAICVAAGVGLLFAKQRSWRLIAAALVIPAAYFFLHPLVPAFRLW